MQAFCKLKKNLIGIDFLPSSGKRGESMEFEGEGGGINELYISKGPWKPSGE